MKNVSLMLAIPLALGAWKPLGQIHSCLYPPSPVAMQRAASDPLREAEDLLQKQQYAQAEEKLQPLMNEQAKNPQAWFDLGFAQSRQSKTKEAIADYQKAVELAPDWFEANLNLGL